MQVNDENIRLVLSKNIKLARTTLGLTQEILAEHANISVGFLKDLEASKSGASLVTLIALCRSLDTTPNQILKEFFQDSMDTSSHIVQQVHLLDEYHKDAILSLIQYFNRHKSNFLL